MDEPQAPLKRLWRYATNHRRRIVVASAWSFLNKAVDIAPPLLIGAAVDIVVRQDESFLAQLGVTTPRAQLVLLTIVTLVIWVLESLFEYLLGIEWRNLAQSIQHELRVDTYSHLQGLEMSYFEDRESGDLLAILNDDVNQLERFMDHGANDIIQVSTTVVLIGAIFFWLAPTIAWLAFLPIPFIVYGSVKYQKKLEPHYADVRNQAGAVNSQLANNLGGMATIKSFNAERAETRRIEQASDEYRVANRGAIRLSSAFSPLIRLAILVGFTATLLLGGFLALEGTLAVGAYSVMVFLTQRLLWPLTSLGQTFDLYQRAMASTNRILDVIDTEAEIVDGTDEIAMVDGAVAFRAVSFSYQPGFPVIRDVSLEMASGKTTALVGATGSGKTTIVKLLFRFYDVDEGTITLDETDTRKLRLRDLRRTFGLVSQDVYLFHGTVADNIAYGNPGATLAEIRHAAEVAEAHDFIMELPLGYETIVGERGQKLSGGQRQRVSIARAVLVDPPVLVLDEATSAVDNETEAAIQRSLERISHERASIVIAHRLSTIRHADRIYVLDKGQVVEVGTHDELILIPDGLYKSLWDVQTGEAVEHVEHVE